MALISIIMSDIVGRLKFLRNLNDYHLTFLKNFSKKIKAFYFTFKKAQGTSKFFEEKKSVELGF